MRKIRIGNNFWIQYWLPKIQDCFLISITGNIGRAKLLNCVLHRELLAHIHHGSSLLIPPWQLKFIPTVWRESKIWDCLCQHLPDQSQSCGFLFCLNPRKFPWWIHRPALDPGWKPPLGRKAPLHHLTVPSEESAQHRQQARRADGINRDFF